MAEELLAGGEVVGPLRDAKGSSLEEEMEDRVLMVAEARVGVGHE